eukprot:3677868-Prymnesium_polylepis.1
MRRRRRWAEAKPVASEQSALKPSAIACEIAFMRRTLARPVPLASCSMPAATTCTMRVPGTSRTVESFARSARWACSRSTKTGRSLEGIALSSSSRSGASTSAGSTGSASTNPT